jgi:DNA-binding CsgD family transcriptional regulator
MTGRPPKLTASQVRELRAWAAYGRSLAAVARRLGIGRSTAATYLRDEHKAFRREAA